MKKEIEPVESISVGDVFISVSGDYEYKVLAVIGFIVAIKTRHKDQKYYYERIDWWLLDNFKMSICKKITLTPN